MANTILDAKTVHEKMGTYGHNYNPEGQAYRYSIAGAYVVLYDLNSTRVEVLAENVDYYMAKGFAYTEKEADKARKAREDEKTPEKFKSKAQDDANAEAARLAASEEAKSSRPTKAAGDSDGKGAKALKDTQERSNVGAPANQPTGPRVPGEDREHVMGAAGHAPEAPEAPAR